MKLLLSLTAILLFSLSFAQPKPKTETAAVRQFVQGFYDWYISLSSKEKTESPSDTAIRTRSSSFTPQLLKALKEDSEASKKSPGEIVGLDFDPFLASQDPYDTYKAVKVTQRGQSFNVLIHGFAGGKEQTQGTIVAVLVKSGGKYRFSNFVYPDEKSDLITILRQLKKERARPAKAKAN